MRALEARFHIFPFLLKYYVFQKERELLENIRTIRGELKKLVLEKKEKLEKNSAEAEKGDLMTILLSDDIFKDDIEMTLDECLTFFAAGTQTTVSLMTTVLSNVIKNPEIN
mmetsp:Transcript_30476/g.29857  ORF Transcript_30476/g.29857 Transcript_30476/m.29857 type:complete len:111 (+) Transcript_30476:363-695(+)